MQHNGVNSHLFVSGVVEIYKFKAKDYAINVAPLCLKNVSKDFLADDMKKTTLYGCVYHILDDYDSVDVGDKIFINI